MDIFLLPSLYEGLGMVLIEAQCAGLPCICSTEVPSVAKVTPNLEFLSLKNKDLIWAKKIKKISKNDKRKDFSNEIRKNSYDIKIEAKKLEKKYLEYI